jgi:hypothetical protein
LTALLATSGTTPILVLYQNLRSSSFAIGLHDS